MYQWITGALFALLVFTGCSTMKITTDHDPEFAFESLNNYTLLVQQEKSIDSLTQGHITRAIQQNLDTKGYLETSKEEANFYILFQVDVQDKTEVQTTYEAWGIQPYPYYHPSGKLIRPPLTPSHHYIDPFNVSMMVGTTQTYEYQEGKLIVDAYDPKSKKVVWRGIAKDELRDFKSAQEKIDYINKVITHLFETFPAHTTGK